MLQNKRYLKFSDPSLKFNSRYAAAISGLNDHLVLYYERIYFKTKMALNAAHKRLNILTYMHYKNMRVRFMSSACKSLELV
jgi:hypothetical protein